MFTPKQLGFMDVPPPQIWYFWYSLIHSHIGTQNWLVWCWWYKLHTVSHVYSIITVNAGSVPIFPYWKSIWIPEDAPLTDNEKKRKKKSTISYYIQITKNPQKKTISICYKAMKSHRTWANFWSRTRSSSLPGRQRHPRIVCHLWSKAVPPCHVLTRLVYDKRKRPWVR